MSLSGSVERWLVFVRLFHGFCFMHYALGMAVAITVLRMHDTLINRLH